MAKEQKTAEEVIRERRKWLNENHIADWDRADTIFVMESYASQTTEALQAFKDYVHKRLDDMGIPVDPESPHKAAGCRIGGRLDVVEALQAENERLKKTLADKINFDYDSKISEQAERIQRLTELLNRATKMLPAYIAGTADINPESESLFYEIKEALLSPNSEKP